MTENSKLQCLICGHSWWPHSPEKLPDCCPRCKNRNWATGVTKRPRKHKPVASATVAAMAQAG